MNMFTWTKHYNRTIYRQLVFITAVKGSDIEHNAQALNMHTHHCNN